MSKTSPAASPAAVPGSVRFASPSSDGLARNSSSTASSRRRHRDRRVGPVQAQRQQGQHAVADREPGQRPEAQPAAHAQRRARRRRPQQVLHLRPEVGTRQHVQEDPGDRQDQQADQQPARREFLQVAGPRGGCERAPGARGHEQVDDAEAEREQRQQAPQREGAGALEHLVERGLAGVQGGVFAAVGKVVVLVALQAPPQPGHRQQAGDEGHDAEQAQPGRCLGRSRQRRVGRHDQHEHDEHRQPGEVGAPQRAGEAQALPAPAGVGQPEAHRGRQQDRPDQRDHHEGQQSRDPRGLARHRVQHRQQHHEQVAAQHLARVGVVVHRLAADPRVGVEVAQPPHLGPGMVEAERHHAQQQVDDPDAEVVAARAGKPHRQPGPGGDGRLAAVAVQRRALLRRRHRAHLLLKTTVAAPWRRPGRRRSVLLPPGCADAAAHRVPLE